MKTSSRMGLALSGLLLSSGSFLRAENPPPLVPTDVQLMMASFAANDEPAVADTTKYGVQVLLASPQDDFRSITAKTGLGVGAFVEQSLTPSSVIQTRADYVQYGRVTDPNGSSGNDFIPANALAVKADTASVGVDVRQYLPISNFRCLYVLAGVSATRFEFRADYVSSALDANGIPIPGVIEQKSKTSTKCGLAVGAGYDFQGRVALTVRYTMVPTDGSTLATVETGLSFRF